MNEYEVISLLVCSGNTDIKKWKKKKKRKPQSQAFGEKMRWLRVDQALNFHHIPASCVILCKLVNLSGLVSSAIK